MNNKVIALKLKDFATVNMGQSPKSEFYNHEGNGLPFLQGNRTFRDKYPIYDTWTTSYTKIAYKDEVLMSVRAPVGDINLSDREICIGRGLCSITMNNSNNQYLYYLLKNNVTKFLRSETGTVFGSINKISIENMKLKIITNKEEQIRIANILSSFDDKIEINNKINKNLEELVQALYKHWFVDFEFPNEEGTPYKSSGGNMIDSKIGLIPEGWEIIILKDIIERTRIKKEHNKDEKLIDLASMPQYSIGLNIFEDGDKLKTNTFEMKEGEYLYGSIRPYLGKYGIAPYDGLTTGTIHHYTSKDINDYSLVGAVTFSKDFNSFCIQLSHGTKMPIIKWNDFITYNFAYNSSYAMKFNEKIKPIFTKIIMNVKENNKLAEMRDLLLPKLMSGEIRIPVKE